MNAIASLRLSDAVEATPIGPPPPSPDLPVPPPDAPPAPPAPAPVVDPPAVDPPMTEPGKSPAVGDPPPGALADAGRFVDASSNDAAGVVVALGRLHARRLRDVYRSAGWPCCDAIEIDLLAAGLLERMRSPEGHETVRVTDAGIAHIARTLVVNRSVMSKHEALVERMAREMTRSGRIAWRGLSLRARLPASVDAAAVGTDDASPSSAKARWCIARPDVFSIRNTSVEAYAQPIVHEVKVHRADLLSDLRKPDKRAAYLDLGGECWYVLGCNAKGEPIGEPDEIPPEFGVLIAREERLVVARSAVHRALPRMPFSVWLALAKAQPVAGFDQETQDMLAGIEA